MKIQAYPIVRSLASYMLPSKILKRPGSGGTFSSKYCYSVWLRHLVSLVRNNVIADVIQLKKIAEIGPGDSLGIGLSALYTGADTYFAFDVIEHSNLEKNLKINDELHNYFLSSLDIPNGKGFESVAPILNDYSFPLDLLKYDSEYFNLRHKIIKESLLNNNEEIKIKYIVPWTSAKVPGVKDLDLIFSQAVMEHIDDIGFAYREMYKYLKKGGIISHQIDFKTHEMTKEWNGHWFISESVWKFLLKGRKYPINRLPLSAHINMIKNVGFEIKAVIPVHRNNFFNNKKTKVPSTTFTDEDLITSGALIQAIKL